MQVAGVLAQNARAVRTYIEETGLPFDILIDEHRDVARAYGVWHRIGIDAWNIARPALFLIAPDRRIFYSFVGDSQREFPSAEEIVAAIDAAR